jgi:tRNA(Arg) A34 adenosine deaminase TadA
MEGAVLVLDGQMIGVGHRGQEHAALICLKDAGLLSHAEMERATIYLTHWPCSCCLDSLRSSGIRQLVVPAKGEAREVPGIEVLALELMDDGSEWRLRPGSEAP